MSDIHRGTSHNQREAMPKKPMRQKNLLLLPAVVLILGGIGALVWLGWQTAVPQPTSNSYGAPALAQQGETAVNFALDALDGAGIALSDYEGDVIIMNFWATWCPPCRAEMPGLNRFYEAHRDEGLVLLAINEEEGVETVRPFIQANYFTFPVLLDIQGRVAQQYSTRSFPTTFIIDREGIIQHVQTGAISERELEDIIVPLLQ
jgi:peroxiredoxin